MTQRDPEDLRALARGVKRGPEVDPLESTEQEALVSWAWRVLPRYGRRILSVPNERRLPRDRRKAAAIIAALKRRGMATGHPDLLVPGLTPAGGFGGVALEMKRRGGVDGDASEAQRDWIDHYRAIGWAAAVCYGADEAIALLRSVGYAEGGPR